MNIIHGHCPKRKNFMYRWCRVSIAYAYQHNGLPTYRREVHNVYDD